MRIACLQFAPEVGDVDNNLDRADTILNKADPKDIDLLVLPELAFTGYNFKSLTEISPFLEPTGAGISTLWARDAALKYNCFVTVGYPEMVDVSAKWPTSPEYYNSIVTVNRSGDVVANYRKTHLYYTDETWALEGRGFYGGHLDGLGDVAMGICMDVNPYKFEAPWNAWEFAYHVLDCEANLVILSMAWLTYDGPEVQREYPDKPDMHTLTYWLKRLEPLIRGDTEGEIIVIFANRTGVEDNAVYAGTSNVLGIEEGEVKVYGILGRGERELLIVDTNEPPQAKLMLTPTTEPLSATNASDISANSILSKDSQSSMHTDLFSRSTPELEDLEDVDSVILEGDDQYLPEPHSARSQNTNHYTESIETGSVITDSGNARAPQDTDDLRTQVQSASPGHAMKSTTKKIRPNSTLW